MSEDRWATFQTSNSPEAPPKQHSPSDEGIAPSSFHKKRRTKREQSATEKHVAELLQRASKNEVAQKRKDFTAMQKAQLDAYERATSFRIFPLQVCLIGIIDLTVINQQIARDLPNDNFVIIGSCSRFFRRDEENLFKHRITSI